MNPSKKSEKKQKKTQKSKTSDEVLKHVQEMSDIVLSPPKYADSRSKLKRKRESRQRKKQMDAMAIVWSPSHRFRFIVPRGKISELRQTFIVSTPVGQS